MRLLALSVAAVWITVSACTVESADPTDTTRGLSPDLVTSAELFELFVATCVTHFPDGKATKAAFRREGLKTVKKDPTMLEAFGDELGVFEDVRRRLIGGFGTILYELSEGYDGGPLKRAECSVAAEIADPNVNWAPLVASLNARFPSLEWTSAGALQTSFERDGATFDVLVEPQVLGFTWEDATPRCDKVYCDDWYEAKLSIGITK